MTLDHRQAAHATLSWQTSVNADRELDVRGLVCPLPILRTRQSLAGMTTGQILKVMTTDPASSIDFLVFCEQTGNMLLSVSEDHNEFVFFMRKR